LYSYSVRLEGGGVLSRCEGGDSEAIARLLAVFPEREKIEGDAMLAEKHVRHVRSS
jgi:hypothetical protein